MVDRRVVVGARGRWGVVELGRWVGSEGRGGIVEGVGGLRDGRGELGFVGPGAGSCMRACNQEGEFENNSNRCHRPSQVNSTLIVGTRISSAELLECLNVRTFESTII